MPQVHFSSRQSSFVVGPSLSLEISSCLQPQLPPVSTHTDSPPLRLDDLPPHDLARLQRAR